MARYEVRQSDPGRQRLFLAVFSLLLFLLLVASYWFGHSRADHNFAKLENRVEVLNEQLQQSVQLNRDLRREVSLLARSGELDKVAVQAAKEELAHTQEEIVDLKQELAFYESLLTPNDRGSGLYVQSLDVTPLENNQFGYTLILTQVHQNNRLAKGRVTLARAEPSASRQENVEGEDTPDWDAGDILGENTFEFKFFQRIEGIFTISEGAPPTHLMVRVEPLGSRLKGVEKLYDWKELMGALN